MKKILTLITIFTISFSFITCDDDEKNFGLETLEDNSFIAPYVYFTLNGDVTLTHLEGTSSFNFNLHTLSEKDVAHTIYVQQGNNAANRQELMTITEFPSTVTITGDMIATALGDNYDDYIISTNSATTKFKLSGSSTDNTGFELNTENIHGYVTGEAQNAYNFFNLNDIIIIE